MAHIAKIICCLLLAAFLTKCAKTAKTTPEINIFDEIKTIMDKHYFDRSKLPAINSSEELKRFFDNPPVSHIGLYTNEDLDYYELLQIYFPSRGIIRYPGIGVAPRLINGRYFAAFVYAGTPAAHAGILPGDELLTVDGEQYSPVKVFQGKVGKTVKLALRRVQNGPALELEVAVAALNPLETLTASTTNSSRIIERNGLRFGYIRMYSYAGDDYKEFLVNTLSSDSFASANALIFDMRGRWGGAPPDAAEMFVGGSPNVEFITPANETHVSNFRWTKPMVAIIGPETRSGLEIMAYSLKKAGVPVVGTTTRGAVLGGSAFILQNGSLLLIPVVDVKIDGNRLEGVGVSPTIEVNSALEYSQGNDYQLEAALDKIIDLSTVVDKIYLKL